MGLRKNPADATGVFCYIDDYVDTVRCDSAVKWCSRTLAGRFVGSDLNRGEPAKAY
jgi:hypothetical protein